jgi:hypothetical protein
MQATDAKRLFLGAAGAAALGLAVGGLLRPDLTLQTGSQEMTPQPQAQFEDVPPAVAYTGHVPDYVIGTDWLPRNDSGAARVIAEATPPPAYDDAPDETIERASDDVDYAEAHPADDDFAAPEPVVYPSEGGGIVDERYSTEPQSSAQEETLAPPPAV